MKAKGIGVYFEEQALDSLKSENEMALGIYSVLAQAESENISANVQWGIRQRMQSGTFKFRYNLLGYRKGDDGEPEIVEEEAKYISAIFNMYLDGKRKTTRPFLLPLSGAWILRFSLPKKNLRETQKRPA